MATIVGILEITRINVIHTYACMYIRTCIHTYVHTYIHTYIHMHVLRRGDQWPHQC